VAVEDETTTGGDPDLVDDSLISKQEARAPGATSYLAGRRPSLAYLMIVP
jgi:hypothetical protein